MTCAQHPERSATAFCQDCGKPLCPACTRAYEGLVLCEASLAQRYPAAAQPGPQPGPQPGSEPHPGWSAVPGETASPFVNPAPNTQAGAQAEGSSNPAGGGASPGSAGYRPVAGYASLPYTAAAPRPSPAGANPVLAGLLGFIPGVGAMYNGQFIKAFLHVAIFAFLISLTDSHDYAGVLIPAWIFYQVFDAAQTAAARRDGTPLPDPLGLLDISRRLGPDSTTYPPTPPPPTPPPSAPPPPPAGGFARTYGAGGPVTLSVEYSRDSNEPIGAVVLIAVGLLFLTSTLGLFHGNLLGRLWPVLLLALGVWLLFRRVRTTPASVPAPTPDPARRSPYSITPEPTASPESKPEMREDQP